MVSLWPSLTDELAGNIPEGVALQYYHISTPPTRCLDIYSPTPGQQPEKTYSESHFLTVSISAGKNGDEDQVAIFAIELILYTTKRLSTLFVSKADSTGYAYLLDFPKRHGSILQVITSTFISWLVRSRTRPSIRTVLSLFARAQGQYLFPGSVENDKKHVLDDRGLVKWWCKTLDPIVRGYPLEEVQKGVTMGHRETEPKAYLIVPGLDTHETSAFFPASARQDPPDSKRWVNNHPLRQICASPSAPPRCVIPHFPDDPKSRFLDELDEEISDIPSSSQQAKLESPSKRGAGQWKSVKTLEQFWEMMAYRQECSSGRLVGFIWVVFTPAGADDVFNTPLHSRSSSPTPLKRKAPSSPSTNLPPPPPSKKKPHKHLPLTGPIHPRCPRVKSSARIHSNRPERTPYYSWPPGTRGTLVLAQKQYDRVHEILLRLDFASLEVAAASTNKWVSEAGVVAGLGAVDWGVCVVGIKKGVKVERGGEGQGGVNVLVAKRKIKNVDSTTGIFDKTNASERRTPPPPSHVETAQPTILGTNLIRKKPKPKPEQSPAHTPPPTDQPPINNLNSTLVRKKAKIP